MKFKYFLFLFCSPISSFFLGQNSFSGEWKGSIYQNNVDDSNALVTYFSISKFKSLSDVKVRIEAQQTTDFSFFNLKGMFTNDSLVYSDFQLDKKQKLFSNYDKMSLTIKYVDSTGYLEGIFRNISSNKIVRRVVMFKTSDTFISGVKNEVSHSWFYKFQKEYLSGMIAPDLRDAERKNFQFQSIYFDPAKAELKSEYRNYLIKVIKVVNGHSDLRLKIIGHTDWNGSDAYNEELSKNRAEVIMEFLQKNGLSRDRIEFEFKGEKKPIDSNETPEGRKRNRRVDFEFI